MTTRLGAATVTSTERAAAVGATALVVAALTPPQLVQGGPTLCPFRRLTGLPCPACGLTRSWVHTAHLRLDEAIAAHPLGPVTVLAAAALIIIVVFNRVRRRAPVDLVHLARHPATLAFATIWLIVAVARMTHGT